MPALTRIEIGTRPGFLDSRGASVERRIQRHLGFEVESVRTRDVYHVDAELTDEEARRIAEEFAGPVVRQGAVGRLEGRPFDYAVSVGFKPGVTDPVGKSAKVAIEDLLGRSLGPAAAVFTSTLYLLVHVTREEAERVARELLANEVIERIDVASWAEWQDSEPDLSIPRVGDTPVPPLQTVDLDLDDEALVALSREKLLALSLDEMRAIRDHFRAAGDDPRRKQRGLGAQPTDAELECLAQTWSEHCKHKIMNARIRYEGPGEAAFTVDSLFTEYIRGTTSAVEDALRARGDGESWLVSVFHDNAGVIQATPEHHLVFKVETHNSPSALDPYGGAITGIVGVNRDPFGTGLGAELLSNVWGYCFASPRHSLDLPEGLLHPRRIREGVHAGVIDGGNQSGVPYGRGWEFFDERFLGKPLVYCGTVGRMPVETAGRPGEAKLVEPGHHIVMVGGRIGKDGIHGATFSSAELTEESPVQAVQIGDPITQKMMFDFLLEARDLGLYSAITDNGAGGLSSSVGEMAERPGGARLDLSRAPLKYQGLAPWEILVSEAQERMTLAVPGEHLESFLALARRREVEAMELGVFTDDGIFHVLYGEETVCWLPMDFLHEGVPVMELEARFEPVEVPEPERLPEPSAEEGAAILADFLARENLSVDESLCRSYDHEVKGLTIIKPFVGREQDVPSDASVFQVEQGSLVGYALAEGVFPTYSDIDAHAMAQAGVDLAVRRVIAAGARPDRIAALDNYCWPDPLPGELNPDAAHKLAQLVRASRGLSEICVAYRVPLISGKDSMKNDAVIGGRRISIPPTLLASTIAIVDDVRRAITLEPRGGDERLLLVGTTGEELGGTEWATRRGLAFPGVPRCEPHAWAIRYERISALIREGVVSAAHAPGRGGLGPAVFRMALAGRSGVEIDLARVPSASGVGWEARLFGESCGRMLLACAASRVDEVLERLASEPVAEIGSLSEKSLLRVRLAGREIVRAEMSALEECWKTGLTEASEAGR